ncbi:MAG: tetratricopeptide repeat protein, partial [Kiritimatiellae bacterium]|nr:tetratricopeptide repeat protein [Kiritimatiellia bacterium]
WDAAAGLAQVRILEANLRTRLDGIATWPSAFSRDTARLSRALAENAWRFSVVAPPWLDVWGGAPVATDLPENRSLHIVARANRASLQPTVALHDAESFVSVTPQRIVEQLRDIGADGVFVDAEDFPAERLADLRSYLATLHNELSSAAMVLTARLPATVQTRISAAQTMAPLVKSRMASDTGLPPPGFPAQRMAVMVRLLPPGPDDSAGAVAQIEGAALDGGDDESADSPAAMLRLRALGIKAYADGDYAEAVEYWRQWASHDAENPEASAYLGNAWNRMRDTPRAIEAYRKSLDIEPGQIDLALELARLYETAGRDSEGAALLDAYARAYPDNRRVSVAQALWLDRHGSRLAGRAIVRKLVDDDPTDIQCRLTLQTLLDSPSERYANMHELLSQVSAAGEAQRLGFGRDIAEAELLTIPESTVFFDFIRDAATNSVRDVVRKLYSGFLPFSAPVTENFGESRLSDRWISFGTPLAEIAGTYDLKAAANMSEAYLRLKQSELLRDGFIEVVVGESVGAFWLYARRSSRNMVRFGFDGDGFLRIQTWSDGEPRTVDSKPWVRPAGDLTLRLEIRGDGAVGHVNGKRVFSNPLPIPSDIAYGWWSVAPFSPELGIARARISRISAGPLAPAIAMLRETDGALAAEALDRLRVRAHEISAVAPVLFVQHPDGTILDEPISDLMPFRMFCSYHRLRLMPVVSLDFHSDVRPQVLVDIILKHRFSGLVLMVRSLPSEEWFREATALIEKTSADLVVVQSKDPIWESGDPAPEEEAEERLLSLPPVTMRELERGSLLLPPVRMSWSVPITPFGKWSGAVEDEETTTPSLVVLPRAAAKAAENPEAVDTQAPRE